MKSICLSLAAAATIVLAIAAPISGAAARTPTGTPAPAVRAPAGPVVPPRIVVPKMAVQLPPKRVKRRVTSLAQLPPKLRAQIRRNLQPFFKKRMASLGIVPGGGTHSPPTEEELDALCDEWIMIYDEDENGDPVPGSATVDCDGEQVWP